jgi:F0F1-type ATP synthase membrane subunit b/b'
MRSGAQPGLLCIVLLQRLEELKRSQEEELEERLDAGVKRILAANRRLAEELRLHVTVSTL